MAKHILVVVSNPATAAQEEEYNNWYSEKHLADVLDVPGFVAAQRFRLNLEAAKSLPGPYLAIYEMETDDPTTTFANLEQATNTGKMPISPALDTVNMVASIFTPITERKVRKD
jgi:hypothetical protein